MKRAPTKNRTKKNPLPFVFVNMAMTADGKIATTNRAISTFGSPRDETHLYELRATADAVMCGARTLDLNHVKLGPGGDKFRRRRLKHGLAGDSLRIIVSGAGTINPAAEIFRHRFSPIIILTTGRASARKLKRLRELADEVKICGQNAIDWPSALLWLREKWGVRRLLCEGGGALNNALFRANVVDKLHLTLCPKIIGGREAPTIADGAGVEKLADARELELRSARRVGDELFLVYHRRKVS